MQISFSKNLTSFIALLKQGSYHHYLLAPISHHSWQTVFDYKMLLCTTEICSIQGLTDFRLHLVSLLIILCLYQNLLQKVLAAAQAVEIGCLPTRSFFGI